MGDNYSEQETKCGVCGEYYLRRAAFDECPHLLRDKVSRQIAGQAVPDWDGARYHPDIITKDDPLFELWENESGYDLPEPVVEGLDEQAIRNWVDDRFGVPNTFNKQQGFGDIEQAKREGMQESYKEATERAVEMAERERILGELENGARLIIKFINSEKGGDTLALVITVRDMLRDMVVALREEKRGE